MRTIKDIIEYASDTSIVAKAIQRNHQTIYYWKRVPLYTYGRSKN